MKAARKLKFNDTFRIARIIAKANIRKEISELLQRGSMANSKDDASIKALGIDFIITIIEKAPNAENEIYKALASLADKEQKEIENAELGEIAELIGDIIKQNKDLKSFFTSALNSPIAERSI